MMPRTRNAVLRMRTMLMKHARMTSRGTIRAVSLSIDIKAAENEVEGWFVCSPRCYYPVAFIFQENSARR